MIDPALELIGLRAGYGRIEALHGVDLVVPAGTIFALLGPNGAGKTTTIGAISGRVAPTAGCVHISGHHVNGTTSAALAKAGLCCVPEGKSIFPNLTVEENLWIATHAVERSLDEVSDRTYSFFPALATKRRQLAGTLSGGEQQMLAMSRALVTDPALMLLDEVSMGLAPRIVADLYGLVTGLTSSGTSILLVEQFAPVALEVADYAAILARGRIQVVGEPSDVQAALSETYLGADR